MSTHQEAGTPASAPGDSLLYNPRVRSIGFQILLVVAVLALVWWIAGNVVENLRSANIASGFGFLNQRAGFEVAQSLFPYSANSTYGAAFLVGLTNTLLVAVIGIFLATILGFLAGVARLSPNWLMRKVATVYIETIRNVPLLLQLLFWYKAVLSVLPGPRDAYLLPAGSTLSNRGLITPQPMFGPGSGALALAIVVGIVSAFLVARWATRRRMATGQSFPTVAVVLGLIIGLPLVVTIITGGPVNWVYPELRGFNFQGGLVIRPEFLALLLGLVIYTGSFIAEIVRAGILAVSQGQTEAAYALGLRPGRTLRLVVIPQAMRVIIPPLTSQFLNLTKNSSLAVAVGYPDLVAVFSGTVLNQTGQAIEVIAITMAVYLTLSLVTSGFMNWFNSRVSLAER
jgi:general L-amino acid transport system permease protein